MIIDNTSTIVSSRIRLARNFDGYAFPPQIRDASQLNNIVNFVSSLLKKCDFEIIKMNEIDDVLRQSLYERYYISSLIVKNDQSAVAINSKKNLSVLINEEDHIREQCIVTGLDLFGAFKIASSLDNMLANNFRFAKLGNSFLTACPSNIGTGMRASVMMFLPALSYSNKIEDIIYDANRNNITLRGAFGEGSNAEGYWYQVSNRRTLGDANEIMETVNNFVLAISDMENDERYSLYGRYKNKFEDRCFRAYGILKSCRLLSYEESVELISEVKLGNALGFIDLKNSVLLDDLSVTLRPNTLRVLIGDNEDYTRAEYVRNALKKIE